MASSRQLAVAHAARERCNLRLVGPQTVALTGSATQLQSLMSSAGITLAETDQQLLLGTQRSRPSQGNKQEWTVQDVQVWPACS